MLSVPHLLLRRSVLRKTSTTPSGKLLLVIPNQGFAVLCAYKFISPTTSSKSAADTSWLLTCTACWFPTRHRKTVRLARPVRLVLERYVTLNRRMIRQMPPILMRRRNLQGKNYKTRRKVSRSVTRITSTVIYSCSVHVYDLLRIFKVS